MESAFGVDHGEFSKIGDWKTIGQREQSQRNNRRRASGVSVAGAAAGGAVAGKLGVDTRGLKKVPTRAKNNAKGTYEAARMMGAGRAESVLHGADAAVAGIKRLPKGNKGALALGAGIGTGLAASGVASAANTRHQVKINQRRKKNYGN